MVIFKKLNPNKKTILIIGGSLGARTINESIWNGLDELKKEGLNNKKMLEEKNNSINSTLDKNETQMVNFYSEFKKHKALRDDLDLRLKAMHTRVSDLEKRQRYTDAWLNDLSDEIRKLQ